MARTRELTDLVDGVAAELDGAPTCVALSGGADSSLLAWAVVQVGCPARAVYVDHGLAHSPMLGDAAAAVAAKVGLAITVKRARRTSMPTSEDQLRVVRHQALESAADASELIATGHTSDDQAETLMANLLRGAGTTGLAGIPQRRQRWVRPLLGWRRSRVRAMADELGLPFVDDPDNLSQDFLRNRIRHDVLPTLAADFNPRLVEGLTSTARHLAKDDAALHALADAVPIHVEADATLLPAPVLATIPPAVAARAVRAALRIAHPPYPGSGADVASVLAVALGKVGAAEIGGGLRVVREGPMVAIFPSQVPQPRPRPAPLAVPGTVKFGDWSVSADAEADRPPSNPRDRWHTEIVATPSLEVRVPSPGDRIDIGTGSKPVMEALAEQGVPLRLRSGWPVVVSGARIVWLVGIRRAVWARPTSGVRVVLTADRAPRATATGGRAR